MTEQIKAWAVVGKEDFIAYVSESRKRIEFALDSNQKHGTHAPYKIVELTSTPKIKMTQAEWEEFNSVDKFATVRDVLDNLLTNKNHYPSLYKKLWSNRNAQVEFLQLWASENPEELVEIEQEQRYLLASKFSKGRYAQIKDNFANVYVFEDYATKFTQAEIDELGGDDWLAEMGLKKVEVTE